jgi:hypothetical protein
MVTLRRMTRGRSRRRMVTLRKMTSHHRMVTLKKMTRAKAWRLRLDPGDLPSRRSILESIRSSPVSEVPTR